MASNTAPTMWLRQVALVAKARDPVRHEIFELFGLDSDFEDEGVSVFGLARLVLVRFGFSSASAVDLGAVALFGFTDFTAGAS